MPAGKVRAVEDAPSSATGRSLELLSLLASEGRSLALADIASRLTWPKATAHRICEQLVGLGYASRDLSDKSYAIGPALERLAYDSLNHGLVRGLRHQVLAELVGKVGETCNFTTLDRGEVLYLDRVEAAWPLRLTLDVGSHVPMHCTASGKLFLASMAAAERDTFIARATLARMTPKTIVDRAALRAECERIARDGHSCDREEFITGLIAVAVPVRDADGAVRAAVAVHAPVARLSLRGALAKVAALRDAAKKMERLLGFGPKA